MLFAGIVCTSCGTYRQNILFQVSDPALTQQVERAEANYTIQRNDLLSMEVFTNNGEKIVDPNRQSFQDANGVSSEPRPFQYPVDAGGMVRFPLIEPVKLEGMTLRQAEALLQQAYEPFYEDPWVVLRFTNKRVIVLGAPGGQVIPLENENVRLTEILALAKGITADGKGHNIRVIRGDQIFVADFSTFEGYRSSDYVMQPGDIVYVEPVRKPFTEALRDYSPMISIVSGLATLIFIVSQIN